MFRSKNQIVLKSIPAKTVIYANFAVMIVAIYVSNRSLAVKEIARKQSRHSHDSKPGGIPRAFRVILF
jgi:hypothetical protein